MSSAYSVSLFTGWDGEYVQQVWLKSRVPAGAPEPPPSLFGALRATVERHPLIELAAEHCTAQLGVAGPWHERLPHFRMDHTPSNGAELQSEYFVPREQAVPALRAIRALAGRITPLLMISEVRTVAADRLWMSPSYERESVGIHFTWQPDWPAVRQVLPMIEAALAPWAARPHWGKLFTVTPDELRRHYPRLPDFQALLRSFDPHGIFRNAMLDAYVFGEG
jgi:xylitol oxidase